MSVLFRAAPQPARRDFLGIPGAVSPRTGVANYHYDELDALRIAAVVACVGLRAGAFAQLPLKGYQDIGDVRTLLSPQPELLRSPSDAVVPSVWKTQMSISRDLWGFALGQVTAWDAAYYPARVEWIDPTTISHAMKGAEVVWTRRGAGILDPSSLVHIPSRWVIPGDPIGISPLAYSGLTDLARKAQDFGRDWFANGAVPSSIIYSDQPLTEEQANGIVDRILSRWQARKPAVLGAGLKHETISVAANESQFLETCNKVAADIATSFNLPPSKIGAAISGQNVTYANRDQDQLAYLVDSINPDLVVIEESLDRHSPRSQYCKFSTGAFLRSDLKTRYEAAKIAIEAQFLHPDEVRKLEELPPLTPEQLASMPKHVPATQANATPAAKSVTVDEVLQLIAATRPEERTTEAPVVNVHMPDQRTEAPVVHAHITVPVEVKQAPTIVELPTNEVRVNVEQPKGDTVRTVERDTDGRISRIIEETN